MQENNEQLKTLGKRIKEIREAKKLTLSEMCYKNALEPSTLSRIEHGLVDPKYLTLLKIADALKMKLSEIVDI